MRNISPGINRSFSAEEYPIFPKESWKNARGKAKAAIKTDTKFEAYATDIDPKCVEIASAAAKRAGVDDMLNIFTMDALDIDTRRTPRDYRNKSSLRRQTSYRGRGERPLPRDGAGILTARQVADLRHNPVGGVPEAVRQTCGQDKKALQRHDTVLLLSVLQTTE